MLNPEKDPGSDTPVLDVSRVAAAHAIAAIREQYSGAQAVAQDKPTEYRMTINPEQKVRVITPPADDFDFLGAFREFDEKVQLPDMSTMMQDPDAPIAPSFRDEPSPDSSERGVSDQMISLMEQDSVMDRMVY